MILTHFVGKFIKKKLAGKFTFFGKNDILKSDWPLPGGAGSVGSAQAGRSVLGGGKRMEKQVFVSRVCSGSDADLPVCGDYARAGFFRACYKLFCCGRVLAAMAAFACFLLAGVRVQAAETTTLRVISTADIHNRINSEDYDVAAKNNTKSLARLNTMIKGARAEMNGGSSITVDVGDSVYGYGAETIMGGELTPNNDLQPIFAAMSKIGYDALTLGNHDFDYGYTFITNQLEQAGLADACIVANVREWDSGKYPWQKSKMITRELTTSQGNTVSIKIGVVGVTRAALSTYYDYNGILKGESTLKAVRTQAAALKKQGADIVVALAHCAFGKENPSDDEYDVGYALSKISDVDCVMLGHQHKNYPSDDANARSFYTLPNTSRETGLTNGKPVVMVADHAAGIGIADLTLKVSGDKVSVIGAKTEVRKCNQFVMEDPEIANAVVNEDNVIKDTYNEILAGVEDGSAITGYFGMLEDNYAVQLDNEAKIRFGLNYIHSTAGAKYAGYHVIAATRCYLDGSEGRDDYIEVGSNFTMKDVLNTQEYQHNNNYAYWITGAQVREWLEWSASIYAQKDETILADKALSQLMQENNASSVVADQWLDGWSNFTVFDGLEYEIDASRPPRYNIDGDVINADSRRIVKLTCNGEEVTDTTEFILVYKYVSAGEAVINAIFNQRLTQKELRSAIYLRDYVKELGSFGPLKNKADNNWSVSFEGISAHVLRSSSLSELYAAIKPWYRSTLKVTEDYAYYKADLSNGTKTEDKTGPLLVLCPSTTGETSQNVVIYVQASDSSGIAKVYYLTGKHEESDAEWETAAELEDGKLSVSENGVYSVCAVDSNGNRTVKNIEITNINGGVLHVPTVSKFTNKMTEVKGEAYAGLTVHITIGEKTYNTTVAEDGTYTCTVGEQLAGETVTVYVSDNEGRASEKVTTTVVRRGPNAPSLNSVTNKTMTLSGKINNANSTVLAYVGSTVYVPKNKESIYKGCTKYSAKKTIQQAISYTVKDGNYYIKVPAPVAKKEITIFAVDATGACSLTQKQLVEEEAPNQPKVNSICEVERYVAGKIPSNSKVCTVTVKAGGQSFKAKSSKNGKFLVKTKGFSAGTVVQVSASDSQNGKTRTSVVTECTVGAAQKYTASSGKSVVTVGSINNRQTVIQGVVKTSGIVYLNYGDTSAQLDLNADGSFSYTLPSPLEGGSDIYLSCHNKTSGEIEEVKRVTVKTKKPEKPSIVEKNISKKAQTITVLSVEKATVVVKVGGKKIKVTDCRYNAKKERFVYSVDIPKGKGKIICFVRNAVGTSKSISVIRKK